MAESQKSKYIKSMQQCNMKLVIKISAFWWFSVCVSGSIYKSGDIFECILQEHYCLEKFQEPFVKFQESLPENRMQNLVFEDLRTMRSAKVTLLFLMVSSGIPLETWKWQRICIKGNSRSDIYRRVNVFL
ncbi:hypothetical protein Bca4012_057443 [Brassica carinata]